MSVAHADEISDRTGINDLASNVQQGFIPPYINGAGFSRANVFTTGTAATWNIPTNVQQFKVTLVGGGGAGGSISGFPAAASGHGSGGGSGGAGVLIIETIPGVTSVTYTVGSGGTASANSTGFNGANTSIVYNNISFVAGGGGGGPHYLSPLYHLPGAGGTNSFPNTGTTGSSYVRLNVSGQAGGPGGIPAAANQINTRGGNTPLGFGIGGKMPHANSVGNPATGFGAGGSGATAKTQGANTGGAGTAGIIIFEY
jgi:hypothetical protein